MENFIETRDEKMKIYLSKVMLELPPFASRYFGGVNLTWWSKRNYSQELRHFFNWLLTETQEFKNIQIQDFTTKNMNQITIAQMEQYMAEIRLNKGIHTFIRRIATLRAFFKYFHIRGELVGNVTMLINIPKPPEKPITTLSQDEVKKLFTVQPELCQKNIKRNRAILLFLVSTGVRVSELVGLNTDDINFTFKSFIVHRKGGNTEVLYMTDLLFDVMTEYLHDRDLIDNQPVFISNKKGRITIKAVQDIVSKYVKQAGIKKRISPHKLRSTFGTTLYEKTRDIYMVSACLGHSDVNTTRKHYACVRDDLKREAMRTFDIVSGF